jgi:putative ABC transport system permease protein
MLIGTNAAEAPYPMLRGRWIDPSHTDSFEAVLSADAAQRLSDDTHRVDVGSEVSAGIGENAQKLTVVGIVDTPVITAGSNTPGSLGGPQVRGPSSGGLYVPMKLAETILVRPAQVSFVALIVKPGEDVTRFRFSWQARFDRANPPVQFQNAQELEEELDASQTARNMLMQAYSATGISLLAALFITFTTLSMGVSERARQFAILRAVALTRLQIAGIITLESLILAVLGWIGGLAAGWVLLWLLSSANHDLLSPYALLGPWSVSLSAICAFGGAFLASIVPATQAMRLRPLDALAPRRTTTPRHLPFVALILGVVLVALNPLLTFYIPMADESRYALYMALGCTSMAVGFMLLAPTAVVLAERLFGPALAAILRLEPRLLQGQLVTNLWRSVGTSVSMTIGLGLFIAMQVWGYTMLRPFEPGEWVPDAMIAFLPNGLPPEQADAVGRLPGLVPQRCLPLAVEQPKLTYDITGSATRATVTRQDNIVLIGLDPDRGLTGKDPLLKLDWVAGSPETALPLLKQKRGCIVPDHFCRESGLHLGDTFNINPPSDNTRPVEYTIAGVVRLPGWHWMSKFSGVRLNSARSAAMVFADYGTVTRDFELTTIRFFWSDTQGVVDGSALAENARDFAQTVTGYPFQVAGSGFPQNDNGYTIRVTTPGDIRQRIRARADQWIWALSRLPLVTLAVSTIGVLNAILASIRARTWDIGILRALGFTRGTIIRLVIAESLLVGIVACLLSVSFGIMAGWCGSGISQYVSFFGGMHPALIIPWSSLAFGLAATVCLCLLAALWPAIRIGRTETLRLLQAGRAMV